MYIVGSRKCDLVITLDFVYGFEHDTIVNISGHESIVCGSRTTAKLVQVKCNPFFDMLYVMKSVTGDVHCCGRDVMQRKNRSLKSLKPYVPTDIIGKLKVAKLCSEMRSNVSIRPFKN